ncbi:hypothetical protein ACKUB1_11070 [Methanospirillum stamsii]|uniref:hypothetical protein n=1 Tax=Methanospirillum stamsii TaxID=1277351 RepID=UPI0015E87673|nr:hypothetical protein [Methanospirillum stamsii]
MNSDSKSSDEINEYLSMLDGIYMRNQQRVLRFHETKPDTYHPDKVNVMFHG